MFHHISSLGQMKLQKTLQNSKKIIPSNYEMNKKKSAKKRKECSLSIIN
jgi:hypothetical protein